MGFGETLASETAMTPKRWPWSRTSSGSKTSSTNRRGRSSTSSSTKFAPSSTLPSNSTRTSSIFDLFNSKDFQIFQPIRLKKLLLRYLPFQLQKERFPYLIFSIPLIKPIRLKKNYSSFTWPFIYIYKDVIFHI